MQTWVFLGDSITDAGRLWPADSSGIAVPGLGSGYVALLSRYLNQTQRPSIHMINKGHDGFTVPSVLRNLGADCIDYRPDFVSLLVGINDVGIAMNTGVSLRRQGFSETYRRIADTILSQTSASLLCIGPFVFARPERYLLWMDCVREAEALISEIAMQMDVPFLPMLSLFTNAAQKEGYSAVTTDGIHLTGHGHEILAQEILKYLPGSVTE